MLYQKRSGKAARLKYLLTLPLLGGLLCASTMAFTNKTYGWVDIAPQTIDTVKKTSPKASDSSEYERGRKAALRDIAQGRLTTKRPAQLARNSDPSNPTYSSVEGFPEFPGGTQAFSDFFIKHVKYPQAAKEAKVQGRVFVQFVIEKDGSLSDLKILRDPGMGLGDEAVRVLKLSPKWKPGVVGGKNVRTEFTVPVNFALDDNKTIDTAKTTGAVTADIVKTSASGDPIFNAVETQPSFPGGEKAFADFLRTNIHYPAVAKANGVTGRVYVRFIVKKDGALSEIKIIREPGSGLGEEAARVFGLSPKWNPGIQKGERVRVQFTVPVNFSLADVSRSNDTKGLYKFIQDHVRYPAAAKASGIQGRTFVQFTLNANQQIQNIKILRTPDDALGAEVIRVLQKFDTLSDGKSGVTYVIPINFYIDNGEQKDKDGVTPKAKDTQPATPYVTKDGDRVMLNEVVVITHK